MLDKGSASITTQIIAVTGPMAAGKNYYCSKLQQDGWACIDADELVHKAIDIAKDRILDTFTPYAIKQNIKITKAEGSIDRHELGRLLFSIPELLTIQESIVYPIINTWIKDFIAKHEKVVINATVLYKTPELLRLCQRIFFVTAPFFTRLIRARKRDHLSYHQLLKRFWSQRKLLSEYKRFEIPIVLIKNSRNNNYNSKFSGAFKHEPKEIHPKKQQKKL